jgi:hypothetical protein
MKDKMTKTYNDAIPRERPTADEALAHVHEALAGLQFGEVLIVLQDGVIVQVERTERKRFRKSER